MNDAVVSHDPAWEGAFYEEVAAIGAALKGTVIETHHIGSTAIPDILAKPIIDILCVVGSLEALDRNSEQMEKLGYKVLGAYGMSGRRYFRKVDATGTRTHHVHAFETGSEHVERHLAFRDYLRSHPLRAAEYSALKASLLSGQSTSWDAYLDGKEPFIIATQAEAVAWYRESKRAPEAP